MAMINQNWRKQYTQNCKIMRFKFSHFSVTLTKQHYHYRIFSLNWFLVWTKVCHGSHVLFCTMTLARLTEMWSFCNMKCLFCLSINLLQTFSFCEYFKKNFFSPDFVDFHRAALMDSERQTRIFCRFFSQNYEMIIISGSGINSRKEPWLRIQIRLP